MKSEIVFARLHLNSEEVKSVEKELRKVVAGFKKLKFNGIFDTNSIFIYDRHEKTFQDS